MSSETARKIVVASALLGAVTIAYQGHHDNAAAKTTYKRIWGLMLLVAGGSVLADFAPAIVGPYMALVLLGFLVHNQRGLGSLLGQGEKSVSSKQ